VNKEDKELIRQAREDMDETVISSASFRIQTILEEVFQKGIAVGETIGYAKAVMEHADDKKLDQLSHKKPKKGSKE
jgi:hypothetical protein